MDNFNRTIFQSVSELNQKLSSLYSISKINLAENLLRKREPTTPILLSRPELQQFYS